MSNTNSRALTLNNVPTIVNSDDDGIRKYLNEIKRFPMLSATEEYKLAIDWQQHANSTSAHRLVTSHLRLVAKIASGFRGYGLPYGELIAEGNIGLMQAVKKFEPERGFRLATYAMWWIKAMIQEYILRSWSLVKIGTTASQKKLFFNLRKIKSRLKAWNDNELSHEDLQVIAQELSVSEHDVQQMNRRMSHGGDQSLNVRVGEDGTQEWQDWLSDDRPNQEETVLKTSENEYRHDLLVSAMTRLTPREKDIITRRRLQEPADTLENISVDYNISRERIRQIEIKAFEKLQHSITKMVGQQNSDRQKALSDFHQHQ